MHIYFSYNPGWDSDKDDMMSVTLGNISLFQQKSEPSPSEEPASLPINDEDAGIKEKEEEDLFAG